MLFKEQAQIFVQLLVFRAPCSFFCHDIYRRKNEHVCWSNSVKSSTARCFLNAVVSVPRNCWKSSLNIAGINKLSDWHFRNNCRNRDGNRSHPNVLFYRWFKNKMKTRNTMAPSHHSKVSSTQNQRVPFFCCLGHGV